MKVKFMAIYRTLLKALISVLVFSTAILAGKGEQSNPQRKTLMVRQKLPQIETVLQLLFTIDS